MYSNTRTEITIEPDIHDQDDTGTFNYNATLQNTLPNDMRSIPEHVPQLEQIK